MAKSIKEGLRGLDTSQDSSVVAIHAEGLSSISQSLGQRGDRAYQRAAY